MADESKPIHIVLINGTDLERERLANSLTRARVIPVNAGDLDDESRRTLGLETKVLVVRPDGYVALAEDAAGIVKLESYVDSGQLRMLVPGNVRDADRVAAKTT